MDVQTTRINDTSSTLRVFRTQAQSTDRLNTTVRAKTMIRRSCNKIDGGNKLGTTYYRLILAGILGFIIFGASMAYYGYQNTIYPLDKAVGYLSRAESSQTAGGLIDYIKHVKQFLPKEGNPVWSFTTSRTDFGLIQNDLDAMLARAISISSLEPNSAAYNTGLIDLHTSIKIIETNLEEATPYLYAQLHKYTS